MSSLRIALVSEGITDFVIIEAALKAILKDKTFILTQLQPESTTPTQPQPESTTPTQLQPESTTPTLGQGWGGVFRWCRQELLRNFVLCLNSYIKYFNYDFLIIHIDCDVAYKSYEDISFTETQDLGKLPCDRPCPPINNTINELSNVIDSWLAPICIGSLSILCIPAQSSESWLAAAIWGQTIPYTPPLHIDECQQIDLDTNRPKNLKIKKRRIIYEKYTTNIINNWENIKTVCAQANVFERNIIGILDNI